MFHRFFSAGRPALKKCVPYLSRSFATGGPSSSNKLQKGAYLSVGGGLLLGTGLWYAKENKLDSKFASFIKDTYTIVGSTLIVRADRKCNIKTPKPCPPRKKKCKEPQDNVISGLKCYSLYLWITLEPEADPCCVARAACQIQEAIDATKNAGDCDDDEIVAGVGFGPNFYNQNFAPSCKNFCYRTRKGKGGELPAVDGDIFVHAKSDSLGSLFDFCKHYLHKFPEASVLEFEDVYGFTYRCGRDISGFYINRSNRCDEDGLKDVAVECETGGSYALAQKWVHDLCVLDEDCSVLERYIGKEMHSGKDLKCKAPGSHLARMTGSIEENPEPLVEIVQQSQPYGSLADKAGQFFLAFSNDPCNFDCLLDRMVGIDGDHDDVMKMSKNVKGTYWYFPGCEELCDLKKRSGAM